MELKLIEDKQIEILNLTDVLTEIGEYGVHNGFFNTLVMIDGKEFYIQCCMDEAEIYNKEDNSFDFTNFDFTESGYDEGVCGDVNEELANIVGWSNIPEILEFAAKNFY